MKFCHNFIIELNFLLNEYCKLQNQNLLRPNVTRLISETRITPGLDELNVPHVILELVENGVQYIMFAPLGLQRDLMFHVVD